MSNWTRLRLRKILAETGRTLLLACVAMIVAPPIGYLTAELAGQTAGLVAAFTVVGALVWYDSRLANARDRVKIDTEP